VSGRLESGDLATSNGQRDDEYTFTPTSAMRIRVTVRSTDMGPYVFVIDAQVTVNVPAGSIVRIRAASWRNGQGAYTLELSAN
jgi:hypothetical protein